MPKVARGNGTDSVDSATGSGKNCPNPSSTATDACSGDVFINGIGVVRKNDAVQSHAATGCGPESPGLGTHSPNVYANGREIGRLGDNYPGDGSNIISSGSPDVYANGY